MRSKRIGTFGIVAAGLLAFNLAAPSFALGTPRDAPTVSAELPMLEAGKSRFEFSDWHGPAIPVWTYVPDRIDPRTAPIAIIMHGASRNPDDYRDAWVAGADSHGFIVIAPGFSNEDFPGARTYNMGGVLDQNGQPLPRAQWTFSVIEPLFDEVVSRLGGAQTGYTLYGHSAGSQFVHRFMYFMPEARAKRFLFANAGWYTFPDRSIAFPFGLDGTPVNDARLQAVLAKDVVLLLGDQDNDARHRLLNRSREAMRQGRHRFERGQNFFASASQLAQDNGWDFGWKLRVIEGVAHSNSGIAAGAADLIE